MLTELARETLMHPRRLLARIFAMKPGAAARWQAFGAVVIVSTLVSWLFLVAIDRDGSLRPLMPSPLMLAAANALLLLGVTVAVHAIGRGFGGQGRFGDALVAMTVLQAVMLVAQAAQLTMLLIFAPLAQVLGFAGLVLLLWVLANFVMELHGFRSLPRVGLGILAAILALSLVFSLLLFSGMPGPGV